MRRQRVVQGAWFLGVGDISVLLVFFVIHMSFLWLHSHLEKAQQLYRNTIQGEGFWKLFFTVLGGGGLILALIHLLSTL